MTTPVVFAFDFDGVIVDSAPAYVRAINTVGEQLGATRQMDTELLSCMPEYLHQRSAELIGLPESKLAQFSEGLREVFHQEQACLDLRYDMGPLLLALQKNGSVVMVSANEQAVIESALIQLDVSVQNVYAGHGRVGKATVLSQLAQSARVVMIGDTLSDCHAAAAAGVECVAVSWGWQGAELLSHAGVPVVHNSEALQLWLELWSSPNS